MTVRHTSATTEGQIYLSGINWTLAIACVGLVLTFRTATGLAAAYGIAVCGTMTITSIMFALVARRRWHWSRAKVFPIVALFLVFDLGFLASNLLKFALGGYVPILIALVISLMMVTWTLGRSNLAAYYAKRSMAWDEFKARLERDQIARVDTLGVFMASDARGVPPMVLHQAERIRAIPKTALLLTVRFEHAPWLPESERIAELKDLGHGFYRVIARYGFMQQADVPRVIAEVARRLRLSERSEDVTFFLGRESLVSAPGGAMGPLWESMFRVLTRNTIPATAYFRLPPAQVVEIGIQIDL
jgi:KUP system potassium uptake protein